MESGLDGSLASFDEFVKSCEIEWAVEQPSPVCFLELSRCECLPIHRIELISNVFQKLAMCRVVSYILVSVSKDQRVTISE